MAKKRYPRSVKKKTRPSRRGPQVVCYKPTRKLAGWFVRCKTKIDGRKHDLSSIDSPKEAKDVVKTWLTGAPHGSCRVFRETEHCHVKK